MYDDPLKSKAHVRTARGFCAYCKRICKHSLITGFPVIASTRSCFRKLIKTFVFVICTTGFLYQTSDFLRMYFSYTTIANVEMFNPISAELPAITICNTNSLKRSGLCTNNPEFCNFLYPNVSEFCKADPVYCPLDKNQDKINTGTLNLARKFEIPNTWKFTKENGFKRKDLIDFCITMEGKKSSDCGNFVDVQFVDIYNTPNNCFAVESYWGQPKAEPRIVPITKYIRLMLNLQSDEYTEPETLRQVHLVVHDPFALVNPIRDGILLGAGKFYKIMLSQIVKERLKPPYSTNCTDYIELWRKAGGMAPVNRMMCVEKCKLDACVEAGVCISKDISYPHNYPLCSRGQYPVIDMNQLNQHCFDLCPEACRDSTYVMRAEAVNSQSKLGVMQHPHGKGLHEPRNSSRCCTQSISNNEIQASAKVRERGGVQLHRWIHGNVAWHITGGSVRFCRNYCVFMLLSLSQERLQETSSAALRSRTDFLQEIPLIQESTIQQPTKYYFKLHFTDIDYRIEL